MTPDDRQAPGEQRDGADGDAQVPHACPRPGCGAPARLASMDEAFSGDPIWRCEAGHSGPHMIGVDADG